MSDYIVHRGDFIEINSSTIVKVSSFCYINELLEKVITEKVLNITDFLISIVDSVKNLQKAFQKLIKKNLLTLVKILNTMSTINKVNKLKDSISKQSLSYGLISNSYSIEFTLDNDNTKADNVVEVFSLDEAEEIVKCVIAEDINGLNNKVKSYNASMFLTASLILPR